MNANNPRTLKSTETTFEIVDLILELNGARPTELAERLDVSPSTVHAHLATLEKKRYVTNDGGVYDIGLKFMRFDSYVRSRDVEYKRAKKYTEQLADTTGCQIVFVVEEHGRGTYFHICSGEYSKWDNTDEGTQFHLHTTAAGKAILSQLPRERVREIVDEHGLPSNTDNTIDSWEDLVDELEEIRERGYALNREEDISGVSGIGVPVVRQNGEVIGAFGIFGRTEMMINAGLEAELPETAMGIASEFELELILD